MLRLWLLGLLMVCCVTANYFDTKTADKDFLLKQKKVYNLLYHVSQPSTVNLALYNEGKKWSLEDNMDSYNSPVIVKEFLNMYKNGMLPRGELFSVYYPKMLDEMLALFKLFYAANDFNVFYMSALWARLYVNEGQFIFALYNAVLRRPDTKYLQLPQPYEMYPYAFFNSEVLEKAHHPKLYGKLDTQKSGSIETYVLQANYSGWYLNREYELENKLNYFVEDVGLNSYYFLFRHDHPFWLSSQEYGFPVYRGEEYLYGHKQLLNRYNLERLSNDLPKIGDFDWQRPFPVGYYPTMAYHNGLPLPQRPTWSFFPNYKFKYIKELNEIESRLSAAVDSGFMLSINGTLHNIHNSEGLNMLGNTLEGNIDSCNREYFGSVDILGRKVLGYNLEPANSYQVLPSALESFSTCMRDPAFYRLYQRIVSYYDRYKMLQKPYNKDEIVYPPLKVESFNVDKLFTYFDQFDASISNGLLVENEAEAESTLVKVRQYRLNHKPFNYYVTLNADKPMRAAIRLFLGPKYDAHHKFIELPESFKYFYEIDQWMVDLNAGVNKLVRSSKDFFFLTSDPEPSEVLYKKLLKSLDENESFTYNERVAGFPERLLLPRGKKEGMPFQLFLYTSPVSSELQYTSRVWGDYKMDDKPFGFPLDKLIPGFTYNGSNMMFKDVFIYHKDDSEMNMPY